MTETQIRALRRVHTKRLDGGIAHELPGVHLTTIRFLIHAGLLERDHLGYHVTQAGYQALTDNGASVNGVD